MSSVLFPEWDVDKQSFLPQNAGNVEKHYHDYISLVICPVTWVSIINYGTICV